MALGRSKRLAKQTRAHNHLICETRHTRTERTRKCTEEHPVIMYIRSQASRDFNCCQRQHHISHRSTLHVSLSSKLEVLKFLG